MCVVFTDRKTRATKHLHDVTELGGQGCEQVSTAEFSLLAYSQATCYASFQKSSFLSQIWGPVLTLGISVPLMD